MKHFERFLRLMSLASGGLIVALMLYTVLDVFLRYAFNRPFSGSLELTEFFMVLIVFLGLAYCGWVGGHVAVDILERPLENPRLRFIPVILTLTGAVLFLAIAWFTAAEALSTMHRVSNMLRLPHYPFKLVVAFGSLAFAAVLIVQALRQIKKPAGSQHVEG